jgi:hypothetical protein
MQSQISGLEVGAADVGANLAIIDTKLVLISSDISDLKEMYQV